MSYLVPSVSGPGYTFAAAVPGNASTFSNSLAATAVGGVGQQYAPVHLTPFAATGGSYMNNTFTIAPTVIPAQPRQGALFEALAQRQLTYGPYNINGAVQPYPVSASMLAQTQQQAAAAPATPGAMFQPTLESPLLLRDPAPVPTTALGSVLLQSNASPLYIASAWSGGGRAGDRRLGTWTASPFGDSVPVACRGGACSNGLLF